MPYVRPDGELVFVAESFDGLTWIVATRRPTGSLKRVKSPAMPPCRDRATCEENLRRYAERQKWREVPA
jgi:hypothetical protein